MASCNNDDLIARVARNGFAKHNRITLSGYTEDGAKGELAVTAESLNPYGMVHGGGLAALADTVAGAAVRHSTGRNCVTASYGFNFLRPALGSNRKIRCQAVPEKLGKTLCVYRVILTDDRDEIVATGNFTFFLLKEKEG